MADATISSPTPRKGRRWLKIVVGIFGTLLLLVVVAYFVVTSSGFFKSVILPKASQALHAQITVSDASVSPFSQVVLRDLKVQTTGTEPLVAAGEARLRYRLLDIIGGNIRIDEVTLASPTVNLVENPDGTSNLDPILKGQSPPASNDAKPAQSVQASKPVQIDIRKVAVTEGTVRQIKLYTNGKRDLLELSKVNVAVEDLKNGQTGKATLATEVLLQNDPPAPGAAGVLQAKLNGNFSFALSPDLKPTSVKGLTRLEVARAEGALAQAAALAGNLECEVSPSEIKQLQLAFQRGGTPLGQIRISGPFAMEKTEGRLAIEIHGLDKQLLNVVGAGSGIDFGPTTLSATNEIQLAKAGALLTAVGQIRLNHFQVTRTNQTTPQLDLELVYNVTVDRGQSNALVRVLTLTGMQQGQALLQGQLTSPMNIPWGGTASTLGDSAFNLNLNRLNLADWRAFIGDPAVAGLVSVQAKVLAQRGGQQLTFDVDSRITGLDAALSTNRIRHVDLGFLVKGTAADLQLFNLSQYQFQISQQSQPVLTLTGSGTFNTTNQNADLQVTLDAALARLLDLAPQPEMSVSSGTVNLQSHFIQKDQTQTVAGNLALTDFSARLGTNELRRLGLTSDFDLSVKTPLVQIRKLAGRFTQAVNPAATYDFTGTYDLTNQNADLQIALQATLPRLLELLPQPDLRLTAGTLEVKSHFTRKPAAQSVTGTLALADLTGTVGKNQFRQYGLTADLDLSMTPQELQIRKLAGKLVEGNNPGGSFDLSGTYGLTNQAAQFTSKLADFNQNGLRPFLEPLLAEKQLVSVNFSANATANYLPQGDASVKGDLQVKDLVVRDPKGQFPAQPLAARMQVDASILKQVAEIRQFTLGLTPTARATNELSLSGRVDMTRSNAFQGNLKLAADSLDLTSYYDLFAGQPTNPPASSSVRPATQASARPAPAQTGAATDKAPEPIQIPLTNFVAQVNIRRLYLREVEITDLDTSTKVDGGHILVKPFKLSLNGAPVDTTADLDLGIAEYKYDLAFNAQKLPLGPLVNSFQPERKGQVAGTLSAQASIKGAGTSGASLQKNLSGQFDVSSTNLNLSVVNIRNKMLRTIVNVVATLPELIRNPSSGAGSAWAALTGSSKGGLTEDLEKSPIDTITARGNIGSGQINLQQALVQSSAFQANANGTITLASVLTNSTLQIPVGVSLSQPVGKRINMVPANTPTNQTYVALPNFFSMVGTVGNPQRKIDYLALAGAVAQGFGLSGIGKGSTTNLLQGISSLLTNTNASTTNASGSKASGLIQGLGNLLTTPATNSSGSTTATNESPVGDLLKLFGPKKNEKK